VKLLLDHCVPARFAAELSGHEVHAAVALGFELLRNGALLRAGAEAGFDALITVDQNLRYQQNLATLPLAVVVVCAVSNDINELRRLTPQVLAAISVLRPRTLVEVSSGLMP
jgi:hypothetical protein